ncbi:hypothetical protein [Roseinatronobacter sp.]|uniref:hypothetical protein n=1 Tax=Roseinatronobacter sp. TaxID=1945755 RepID=UPI003F72F20F
MKVSYAFRYLKDYILNHPVLSLVWVARHIFYVLAAATSLGYVAYSQSASSSQELTNDFNRIAVTQDSLLNNAIQLQTNLLTQEVSLDLALELEGLRTKAEAGLTSLAQLRAPTKKIRNARQDYQRSLETLIGVVNYTLREGVEDQAIPLHNALQNVSNQAGNLRQTIETFQGGAVPQVLGGLF